MMSGSKGAVGDTAFRQSRRRSRIWFAVGAVIVVGFGVTFASLTIKALSIRSATSSEFSKYVISHGIGHSEVSDDSSGMLSDFCILHLTNPIPAKLLTKQAISLFRIYSELDGGDHLTIEFTPSHGAVQIEADVELLAGGRSVAIVEHDLSGKTTSLSRPVSWQIGSGVAN